MVFILANALHYLGFAAMFAALVLQMNFFQTSVDGSLARKLARTDAVYGLSALLVSIPFLAVMMAHGYGMTG